jgi:Plasmid pRiA4b ORF-3-like protein
MWHMDRPDAVSFHNLTLEGLHDVLQTIMGWANYHLHLFQLGDLMYAEPTAEDRDILDGRKLKLSALAIDGERAFEYVYDYGDYWAAWWCWRR